MHTTVADIYESFESSFKEKTVIPEALEFVWFNKAVGRYSVKLDPLNFDEMTHKFDCKLSQYNIFNYINSNKIRYFHIFT